MSAPLPRSPLRRPRCVVLPSASALSRCAAAVSRLGCCRRQRRVRDPDQLAVVSHSCRRRVVVLVLVDLQLRNLPLGQSSGVQLRYLDSGLQWVTTTLAEVDGAAVWEAVRCERSRRAGGSEIVPGALAGALVRRPTVTTVTTDHSGQLHVPPPAFQHPMCHTPTPPGTRRGNMLKFRIPACADGMGVLGTKSGRGSTVEIPVSYRVTGLTSGLLKRGCASVRHVMLNGGELRGQAVVGEGAADPAGEVASGQVVVENI